MHDAYFQISNDYIVYSYTNNFVYNYEVFYSLKAYECLSKYTYICLHILTEFKFFQIKFKTTHSYSFNYHISITKIMQKSNLLSTERVKIFARIKAPSQNDLYATPQHQTSTRRARSPSPNATTTRRSVSNKSLATKDYLYSFYAHDEPGATKILYFKNPISKKVLEENIRSEDEVEDLQSTILASSQSFAFDRAFSANLK